MFDNPLSYMQSIPPFKDLPAESIRSLAVNLEQIRVPGGKVIFEAGARGDCFYIIREGTVQVYVRESESREKIVLSLLNAGDYFGEMALLTGEPRSASIETMSEVTLIRIDKRGFERLIKENPLILLPLTHMLSHRLKNANAQRINTEKQLLSKIKPSGRLAEISFAELLKYCEQNSLTGKMLVKNKDSAAEILFSKGIVQQVFLNDLRDAEALDVLMQWNQGSFIIEPSMFSFAEEKIHIKDKDHMSKNVPGLLEDLIRQSFEKLVAIVGSQILKEVVGYALKELIPFFPTLEKCTFTVVPKVSAQLDREGKWSDKQTLAIAVLLQTIFKNCRSMVVGMNFLNIEEIAGDDKSALDKISFFEYMAHANEFAI